VGYDDEAVRERLRAERESRGLTQAELAEQLIKHGFDKAHWNTVAKIEAGTRRLQLSEAAALADAFAMSLDSLIDRHPPAAGNLSYAAEKLEATVRAVSRDLHGGAARLADAITDLVAADPEKTHQQTVGDAAQLAALLDAALSLAHQITPREQGDRDA
jgi:transcriptional regulator with XRE-family HTH domain